MLEFPLPVWLRMANERCFWTMRNLVDWGKSVDASGTTLETHYKGVMSLYRANVKYNGRRRRRTVADCWVESWRFDPGTCRRFENEVDASDPLSSSQVIQESS